MVSISHAVLALQFLTWIACGSASHQYNITFSAFGHRDKVMTLHGNRDVRINCLVVPEDFSGTCLVPRMTDAIQVPFMTRVLLDCITAEILARLRVIKTSRDLKKISKYGAEVRALETDIFNWLCRQRCGNMSSCRFLMLIQPHTRPGSVSIELLDHKHLLSVFFPDNDVVLSYILNAAKKREGWLQIHCTKL